ncbi:hypothetical protein E2C01_037274 [Portunus trituberculatus]|uniref:Uncharacterized protein n=1 Tax=Portunus trituberculatus TaxID=210409 RepID=A0A5B7FGN0_PORTR|nr:hypothetical protein [Portunus trituberculatus]
MVSRPGEEIRTDVKYAAKPKITVASEAGGWEPPVASPRPYHHQTQDRSAHVIMLPRLPYVEVEAGGKAKTGASCGGGSGSLSGEDPAD